MAQGLPEIDQAMQVGFELESQRIVNELGAFLRNGEDNDRLQQASGFVQALESAYMTDQLAQLKEVTAQTIAWIVASSIQDQVDPQQRFESFRECLGKSFLLPSDYIPAFLKILRSEFERFQSQELLEEAKEREGFANYLRALNAKDLSVMFLALLKNPRFRPIFEGDAEFVQALTRGNVAAGELHKRFAPIFSKIIANRELRYYLNLAIDDAAQARSRELLYAIEAKESANSRFYIPTVLIGFGVYGQLGNNEMMHAAPDIAAQDVLTMDANPWVGGQFARGSRPFFKVNNRVRPERVDSLARPGTADNIMPLGTHAVVDLPGVSAQTYPSQNLLGSALKVNGFLNSRKCLVNSRVTGIRKTGLSEGQGCFAIDFVERRTNRAYTIHTDIPVICNGIGQPRLAFSDPFDLETRRIIAESRVEVQKGAEAVYYDFDDLEDLTANEGSDWRKRFQGEGIFIGDGDSAIVGVAGVLGYGPDDEGTTQTDYVRKIYWLGQSARNAKEWCETARVRYADIAREFPRDSEAAEQNAVSAPIGPLELFEGQRILSKAFILFRRMEAAFNVYLGDSSQENFQLFCSIYNDYFYKAVQLSSDLKIPQKDFDAGLTADKITTIKARFDRLRLNWPDKELLLRAEKVFYLNKEKAKLAEVNRLLASLEERIPSDAVDGVAFQARSTLWSEIQTFYKTVPDSEKSQLLPSNAIEILGVGSRLPLVVDFRAILLRFRAFIDPQRQVVARLEKELEKVELSKPPLVVASERSDPRQSFARIKPIDAKSVRMAREMVRDPETGVMLRKIRVFYKDDQGQEQSVLGNWVVGCAGVVQKTDDLFLNFEAREASETFSTAEPISLISNARSILSFGQGGPNPLLRGLKVENLEVLQSERADESGKFYAKLKVDTEQAKEYTFEVVGERQNGVVQATRVINGNPSLEAVRIAQALEIWFSRPEVGVVDSFVVNGVQSRKIALNGEDGELQAIPVRLDDPALLLPVASQLRFMGVNEPVFLVGPTNRFDLTREERAEIPALADVTQNLASMFRYVPAAERFFRDVLVPRVRQLKRTEEFSLDRERYKRERGATSAYRREYRARSGTTMSRPSARTIFLGDESRRVLPTIADPELMFRYKLGLFMQNLASDLREEIAKASPLRFSLRVQEGQPVLTFDESKIENAEVLEAIRVLQADPLFQQSLFRMGRPRGRVDRWFDMDCKTMQIIPIQSQTTDT